jgi:hypothetical protein
MKRALVAICVVVACSSQAQGLKNAVKTLTAGNWTVLRDVDPMTDKVGCTGIYKSDYGIQLSDEGMYFRIRGGIEAVTLRFDEDQPQSLRLATDMEKKIGSVILSGYDFTKATSSGRLRYRVSTLVAGPQTGDLDLRGVKEALEHIKANCPTPGKT